MEEGILEFLDTKPHLKKVIFNVHDIVLCPCVRDSKAVSERKKLARWLYNGLKDSPIVITGWNITLYSRDAVLNKYIATRRSNL